jgi:hypothetical protein
MLLKLPANPKVVMYTPPEIPVTEDHTQWLARRMKETGSKTTTMMRVGIDAEYSVEVPSKWDDDDLTHAIDVVREGLK